MDSINLYPRLMLSLVCRHRVNLGEANLSNTSSGNTSSGKQRTMDRFPMTARGGLSGSATEVQQIPKPIEDQQYARLETKWIIPLEQLVVGANLQVSEGKLLSTHPSAYRRHRNARINR